MKVTIELEVSNLQDLAGMIAGAADGVLANAPADQELGKDETAREVKTTAKKAEIKSRVAVQYGGKEIFTDNLLEEVKKVWVEQFEGKLSEIKTIELYIKSEESKAYFVVNGLSNGNYFIYL